MSAFETHNIDHLSASSCNLFAAAPALWVSKYLLKKDAPVGAAAHRGLAVEMGVARALQFPNMLIQDAVDVAVKEYQNRTALSGDPKREAEGKAVPNITSHAIGKLCEYGPGVECQRRIEWKDPSISVPFWGFIDFYWPRHNILIDLKTQLRLSSAIKSPHARQVALYAGEFGDNVDVRVCYVTPLKAEVYQLENVRDHLAALVRIGRTIERFLSVSDDAMELVGLVMPDLDSFYWNDPTTRQIAWDVWGV